MVFLIVMPSPYKPTDNACNEVKKLSGHLASNYSFPRESIFDSKSAPVSWIAGRNIYFFKEPHIMNVCYVTNSEEQEKIVDIITKYKQENKIRSITVKFFEKEYKRTRQVQNGVVTSSGVEGLLSEVKVK
jgi:hypothetical protein